MQTVQELIDLGYKPWEVARMLEASQRHIGKFYGSNFVADITYTGSHERDVTYKCTLCGKTSHKIFVSGRNKWSEFPHSCECQRTGKFPKIKKANSNRNDDPEYIGKVYGDYKVIGFEYQKRKNKSGGAVVWRCECTHCGGEKKGYPSIFKKGGVCQEKRKEERESLWKSRVGEKYGKLTISAFEFKQNGKLRIPYAVCNCECGNTLSAQYSALKHGKTKSCGCIETGIDGRSNSPLYAAWNGMRYRCNNPKSQSYKDYGGRGIKVCEEWNDEKTGFKTFEKWAWDNGYVPDSGLSLDRIDVNGNYEPRNCRYATVYVQVTNQRKRQSKHKSEEFLEIGGEKKSKKEWCKEYNISTAAVDYRINELGMTFEDAIKTPKSRKGNKLAGIQAMARAKDRVKQLNLCQSCIEVNLYMALIRTTAEYSIVPQFKIGQYRVDFLVDGTNVIIECDGCDSHKTKEQILHDSKRDRFLARNGYVVLRFTGSEINSDPDECAREIVESVKIICGDNNARKNNDRSKGQHFKAPA